MGEPDRPLGQATTADDLDHDRYHHRLYVACQTPKSLNAPANLKRFCEEHLTESASGPAEYRPRLFVAGSTHDSMHH